LNVEFTHLRIKSYIQPFERELAFRELQQLTGQRATPADDGQNMFAVRGVKDVGGLVERLAYWEAVRADHEYVVSTQSLREATVNLVRNGVDLDVLRAKLPLTSATAPLPNRRCLRYGTHGIHEYRGKFFPQLVKALVNISGIPDTATVGDPMCGSGTTIIEANLAGRQGVGLDMNPLSVLLSRTKTQLLYANEMSLERAYKDLRDRFCNEAPRNASSLAYFATFTEEDQRYLRMWFAEDVLCGLDDIAIAVNELEDADAKALAKVALSNILRRVSWQKEDDLRVRKEVRLDVEVDPKKEFLEELGRSVRTVLAFLYQSRLREPKRFMIEEGDARECAQHFGHEAVDLVVTSPPYATALPYLDTDRLSLIYLKLLKRPEHRSKDLHMIGNREVTEGLRRSYWDTYAASKTNLPQAVTNVIDQIANLNEGTEAGFRRRNLPSLLAKYFLDMTKVLEGINDCLKPGCFAFIVVGDNHTIAGGQRVDIPTSRLLQDIAARKDFEVAEPLQMEMLVSRDIFRVNAGSSEQIIALRKRC
jgi:hypothetical protein